MSRHYRFVVAHSNPVDLQSTLTLLTRIYEPENVRGVTTYEELMEVPKIMSGPGLILIDSEKPLTDQLQSFEDLLTFLTSDPYFAQFCVVSISKNFNEELMEKCIVLGAIDHIVVPMSQSQAKMLWLNIKKASTTTTSLVHHPHALTENDIKTREIFKLMSTFFNPYVDVELVTFPDINPHDKSLLKIVKDWKFDALCLTEEQLIGCIIVIFENLGMTQTFKLNSEKFHRFLIAVRMNYKENPYHNFRHAVDVLQSFYYMLTNSTVLKYLKEIEILALAVAALCHDLAHPGFNNFFQINAKTPLALLYNNKSVLENFHATATFCLLMRPEFNFVSDLIPSDGKIFRDIVISSILATDMGLHFDFINSLKSRLQNLDTFSLEKKTDVTLMATSLVKCADISNVTRPFEVSKKWADVLLVEFRHQSSMEKSKGLPILPYGAEDLNHPKSQMDFISYVARPLFDSVGTLSKATQSHDNPFDVLLSNLTNNFETWSVKCQESGTPEEPPPPVQPKNEKQAIKDALQGRRKSLPPQQILAYLRAPVLENDLEKDKKKSSPRHRFSHRRSKSESGNLALKDDEDSDSWQPRFEEVSVMKTFDGGAIIYNRRSSIAD